MQLFGAIAGLCGALVLLSLVIENYRLKKRIDLIEKELKKINP